VSAILGARRKEIGNCFAEGQKLFLIKKKVTRMLINQREGKWENINKAIDSLTMKLS